MGGLIAWTVGQYKDKLYTVYYCKTDRHDFSNNYPAIFVVFTLIESGATSDC